jgi:hypothetical protein
MGRDPATLLAIPRADDPAGFRAAMSKLGLPADAAGYEIPVPEGAPKEYAEYMRGIFHRAGLTKSQAKELAVANNEYAAQVEAQQQANYERSITAEKAELLSEWKGGYERMINSAQTAVAALGFSQEIISAIEGEIGYKETMKFLAGLGKRVAEDNFETGTGGGSGYGSTMTPQEASAEWAKMSSNESERAALMDASHPGHKAALQKKSQLFAIMHG